MKRVWVLVLAVIAVGSVCVVAHQDPPKKPSSVAIPESLINRKLTTIENRELALSDYSNKTIVLNLFAPWCGPCISNLKELTQLKKEYTASPIEVIAVVSAQNDLNKAVYEFAREQNLNFPVIWDEHGFDQSLVKLVNGRAVIPQTFIIDKNGRIRQHFSGYNPTTSPRLLREAISDVAANPDPREPE